MPAYKDVSADGTRYHDGDRWGWRSLWLARDAVLALARDRFAVDTEVADLQRSGMLNETWRVGDLAIRVSRPERTLPQLRWEHEVVAALHPSVPEILPPLSGRDGRTIQRVGARLVSAVGWVDGVLGDTVTPERRLRPTATTLARAHRASVRTVALGQRPGHHAIDERDRWFWRRWGPRLRAEVRGVDDCFDLFDDETRRLDAWFTAHERAGTVWPRAAVQGDTNPRNLIFADHPTGVAEDQVIGVIDWDDCQIDLLHAAVAREAWGSPDPEGFWRAYLDAGGPLDPGGFELLAGFARLQAMFELLWTDHSGSVNPFAAEIVRAVAGTVEDQRARIPLTS